jgi:hypothetical protein
VLSTVYVVHSCIKKGGKLLILSLGRVSPFNICGYLLSAGWAGLGVSPDRCNFDPLAKPSSVR